VASLTESRAWVLARRPLLLALVLGFAISLIVSGRFTVRLIADGALSFAFVPLAELAGLALVYYLGRRVLPFAQAVDRFFSGNTAWLWWLLAIMTTRQGGLSHMARLRRPREVLLTRERDQILQLTYVHLILSVIQNADFARCRR
jgi:hypothetical protein